MKRALVILFLLLFLISCGSNDTKIDKTGFASSLPSVGSSRSSSVIFSNSVASFTLTNPSIINIKGDYGSYVIAKTNSDKIDIDLGFIDNSPSKFNYDIKDSSGTVKGSLEDVRSRLEVNLVVIPNMDITQINGCAYLSKPGIYVIPSDIHDSSLAFQHDGKSCCIKIGADDVIIGGTNRLIRENGGNDIAICKESSVLSASGVQRIGIENYPIGIMGNNMSIAFNTFNNIHKEGINVEDSIIGGNVMDNFYGDAAIVSKGGHIFGNTITSNSGGYGLIYDGLSNGYWVNNISGNTFAGTYGFASMNLSSGAYISVADNTFFDNVFVFSDYTSIISNVFNDSEIGLGVYGSGNYLERNIFDNNVIDLRCDSNENEDVGGNIWSTQEGCGWLSGSAKKIKTCQDLQDISLDLNSDYVLANDIDCSGFDFKPIGDYTNYFKGSLDGKGKTISNIQISADVMDILTNYGIGIGIFNYASAEISNFNIIGLDILINKEYTNTLSVGGLIGVAFKHTVVNGVSVADLNINSQDSHHSAIGGLIGYIGDYATLKMDENVSIIGSSVEGVITGITSTVGGLVGFVGNVVSVIDKSYVKFGFSYDAQGFPMQVGGLVGAVTGKIHISESFVNIVDVENKISILSGGLIGSDSNSNFAIYNSYVTGRASVSNFVANTLAPGNLHMLYSNYDRIGGVHNSYSILRYENLFYDGSLSRYVPIHHTYPLLLYFFPDDIPLQSLINNSFGEVLDFSKLSGNLSLLDFCDEPIGAVHKQYDYCNLAILSLQEATTSELKSQSFLESKGWDFDNVWAIDPAINNGYPYLKNNNPNR